MGTIYTSTINVSVWKEHTCACCGCKYRYLFRRKKQGQAGNPDAAAKAAEQAVVRALEREVDLQPCPECGLYQPDMVASRRTLGHWIIFGVAIVPWAVIAFLAAVSAMSLAASAWMIAICFAMTLTAHMAVDVFNPNANLETNRELGRQRLELGDLWMDDASKPDPNGEPPHTGLTGAMLLLYGLMALCAVFAALPELIRVSRGWALNTHVYPCVIGPGDSVTLYSSSQIPSVTKGYWNATGINARVADLADPSRQTPLQADSNHSTWGQNISVSNKESKSSTVTPWAKVQLASNASLAGKPVKVLVDLQISYPQFFPPDKWDNAQTTNHFESVLKLGSSGAGRTYQLAWYLGVLGGGIVMMVLGIALVFVTGSLRNRAHPTEIFVPERPDIEG